MATKTTIILGASAAGIACANKLRSLDQNMKIICLTAEAELPYNRCLLADYLGGIKTAEQIITKPKTFFNEQNISFQSSCKVTAIDSTQQIVTTQNGESFFYDYLFIGTGKCARIPDKQWLSVPGVLPFYDKAHATAIREYITKINAKKAIVIGAGLTGLEAADALVNLGLQVEIIDQANQILPRQIDATGATFLTTLMHKKASVIVHTESFISSLEACHPHHITVTLTSGKKLETNLVIVATGGKSTSFLAEEAGIACDTYGIITDSYMRTSIPTIFAGGDVCSIIDILTKKRISSSLWADAVMQGNVAAHTIAGVHKEYPGALIITSSTIFGTTFVTSGDIPHINTYESRYKQDTDYYHRIFFEQNILKGFIMVGNITGIGQLRKALLEQLPLNIL